MISRSIVTNRLLTMICGTLLVSLLLTAPMTPGEEESCESCHSGFKIFPAELIGPLEVPVGVEFEVTLIVTNPGNNDDSGDDDDDGHPSDLRNIHSELDLTETPHLALSSGSLAVTTPKVPSGATGTVIWTLIASAPGTFTVSCTINGTVHYDHTSDDPDSHPYRVGPIQHTIDVKPLPIRLSSYSLSTIAGQDRQFEVALSTLEPISDLSIILSENLREYSNLTFPQFEGEGDNGNGNEGDGNEGDGNDGDGEGDNGDGSFQFPIHLNASELLQFNLFLSSERKGVEGSLAITWVNFSGVRQSINLSVSIIERPQVIEDSINWNTLFGQVSGILLLGLFGASILFGGYPRKTKIYFARMRFAVGNRILLHCSISYFIIGLTLFHMLVLLVGPWGDSKFDGPLILGYIGLTLFLALGVHGRYQQQLMKQFGYRSWILAHRLLTSGIVVLGLIHAFRIGTHFAFLRGFP
jgi:hypothetical protein